MSPNVSIDDYGTPQEYIGLQSGQAVAAQIAFCLNVCPCFSSVVGLLIYHALP